MLRFVVRKMMRKRWMVLALLIGNILLISITASNPMYTQAVLQRTLTNTLQEYIETQNSYPMAVTITANASAKYNQLVLETEARQSAIPEEFGLPVVEQLCCYSLGSSSLQSNLVRDEKTVGSIVLGCLSDMPEHIELIDGRMYSSEPDEDGVIDVILSERAMINMELIPEEIITCKAYSMPDGEPVRIRIAGVFRNSQEDDPYWVRTPDSYTNTVFMDEGLFRSWFMEGEMKSGVTAAWYTLMDYSAVRVDNVEHILQTCRNMTEYYDGVANQSMYNTFSNMLTSFMQMARKVRTTILVLQVPIFALLASFIFMVSRQMIEMEQAEIAVLKSRGASRMQVITVYLLQSIIAVTISFAVGIPLAGFLVQVLGSANAFLEFVQRSSLHVEIGRQVLAYAGIAAVFSIATMVLPVLRYSKLTIVHQKQRKHKKSDAPLWQKSFLDFITLGVSLYGLYTFNNQQDALAQMVLEGQSLDPLLFLSSSLFMLGAGLVALRILPLFIWLLFTVFKRYWSSALYTSFVKVLRTRNQQVFIMMFLILTIALGVFDSSAACTVNDHNERNLRYTIGADVVLQEVWKDNREQVSEDSSVALEYTEPDFDRYARLEGVESATRVLYSTEGIAGVSGGKVAGVQVMGIHTKEFGETAWFDPELMSVHWYEFLNALSQKSGAVLLSTNFKTKYGYKIGDTINYRIGSNSEIRGVIYGFVDYWPGYAPSIYKKGTDGVYTETDNYLIVGNLSQMQAEWGVLPYQIWIKTKDSSQFLYDFANENNIRYKLFRDAEAEIVTLKNDPIIQGTNGVLTVGFIVVLVLCAVGFLIYWILSIRSRELQFGIFRAMGMSMGEVLLMLINEHIFISGAAIAIGAVVGWLTAKLYMPLIQIAYSSSDRALPLQVVTGSSDMQRLAIIIGLMIVICLVILGGLIRKMKIAQALKLGED